MVNTDSTTKDASGNAHMSYSAQQLSGLKYAPRLNHDKAIDGGEDGRGDVEVATDLKEYLDCYNEVEVEVDVSIDPNACLEDGGKASLDGSNDLHKEAHEAGEVNVEVDKDGFGVLKFDADGLKVH
jgi:hypothetical protein